MKLTCAKCGESHAVPDEEVRGRAVFEFQCEICEEPNVVQLEPEEEAPHDREADEAGEEPRESPGQAADEVDKDDDDEPAAGEAGGEEDDSDAQSAWTGARHEDSALFAARVLKSVASSPAPKVSTSSAPDSESSMERLLDLRAIAAEAAKMGVGPDEVDELADFETGGFDGLPAVSPVSIAQLDARPRRLIPVLVTVSIVLLVTTVTLGTILYVFHFNRSEPTVLVVERSQEPAGSVEPG